MTKTRSGVQNLIKLGAISDLSDVPLRERDDCVRQTIGRLGKEMPARVSRSVMEFTNSQDLESNGN